MSRRLDEGSLAEVPALPAPERRILIGHPKVAR